MPRRKGMNAAAWFYGPTGFGSTRGNVALAPQPIAPQPIAPQPIAPPAPVSAPELPYYSAAESGALVSRAEREEQIDLEIETEEREEWDYQMRRAEWDAMHPEDRCPPRE